MRALGLPCYPHLQAHRALGGRALTGILPPNLDVKQTLFSVFDSMPPWAWGVMGLLAIAELTLGYLIIRAITRGARLCAGWLRERRRRKAARRP
jgi:hypothetical protein